MKAIIFQKKYFFFTSANLEDLKRVFYRRQRWGLLKLYNQNVLCYVEKFCL